MSPPDRPAVFGALIVAAASAGLVWATLIALVFDLIP
jgi:hypothetical protein